jgi:hypothetical protein
MSEGDAGSDEKEVGAPVTLFVDNSAGGPNQLASCVCPFTRHADSGEFERPISHSRGAGLDGNRGQLLQTKRA